MVREIVPFELTNSNGMQRTFTCANGTAIAKGTLLKLTDPRTASSCDASGAMIAGIAAMDKVVNDGSTEISVWTDGIFRAYASGAIGVGVALRSALQAAGDNYLSANELVASAAISASGAGILGYSLETAADDETFLFRLRL